MGLRIDSGGGVLPALRNIRKAGAGQDRALERIATGLRLNRAADGPSGLVLSEQLRTQLSALTQAIENNQNARGLVDTADNALGNVSDLLSHAQALAVAAANDGALDPTQRTVLQHALDQTVDAVDRIGGTTRFGNRPLLNGGLEITTQNVSPAISDLRLFGADLVDGRPRTVSIQVVSSAAPAQAGGTIAPVQPAGSTVRITGPLGSQDFTFAAGQTDVQVAQAINNATSVTGVRAAGAPGAETIQSVDVGSAAFVDVQFLSGSLQGVAAGRTTGADIQAVVDGQPAAGRGNTVTIADDVTGTATFAPGTGPGAYAFTITGGGATFQVGAGFVPIDRITLGIPAVNSNRLGSSSGVGALRSVTTGNGNDMLTNPGNAGRILGAAAGEISALRASLGSVSNRIFQAGEEALAVQFENLSGAESALRDADIAAELAASERFAILRNAGIDVLRNIDLTRGAALRLLL